MRPTPRDRAERDEGSALVITLMVVLLVTVLATTALQVTVNDLSSASRSQQAAAALDAADAGVAQALSYLRSNGVHAINCAPGCSGTWTQGSPAARRLPGTADQSYRVWIEPRAPFPAHDPGIYRVHATGRAANGLRSVEVDVAVGTTGTLPLGLFGRSIDGAGNYGLQRASIFSTGCVWSRSHIAFSNERDAAYGIPTGVHSARVITEANGTGRDCSPSDHKRIHRPGASCATAYPYDQDVLGGSLLSTGCAATQTGHPRFYGARDLDGDGDLDVNGSHLADENALRTLFDVAPEPFTRPELDALRELAQQQGSYFRSTSFTTPNPSVTPHAVMFFDLLGTPSEGRIVDLKEMSGTAWSRPANLSAGAAACKPQSLLIVISGGNVRLNSSVRIAASVVLTSTAPYGQVLKHNGSAEMIGTLYGDAVDLSGTGNLSLDECFVSNLSPAILHGEVDRYVEVDR